MSYEVQTAKVFTVSVNGSRHTTDDQFRFRRKDQIILADDVINTWTTIRLGWMDRLRAIFGRSLVVSIATPVRLVVQLGRPDIEVSAGQSKSRTYVVTLMPKRRATMGMEHAP